MHLVDITMFYAAGGGGVSSYLNAKGRWLARHTDIRHSIVSPNIRRLRGGAPARIGVPSIPFPGVHGYRMPLSVQTSLRVVLRLRPDLVEAGDAGHCAWAALRARDKLGIPVVAYYHSDLPRLIRRRLGVAAGHAAERYLAGLYRQCDLVMAPSRLMAGQLSDMGVAGVVHQPLGIDLGVFKPSGASQGKMRGVNTLRDKLNLGSDARLLVYAGRCTAEKKIDVLVDAMRLLGPPYHLLLIGGGTTIASSPTITRMPFCRDQRVLARLLASCDVLVHPGDCETFGLIVLEAMACGLPVVATGGAVAELVDDANGLIVRPDSAASLAEGIAAIYQRDLAALGAAARRKACRDYDWDRVTPQLLKRYARLLAVDRESEFNVEGWYASARRAEYASVYAGD